MTWFIIIMKSIYIRLSFYNNILLLQKCYKIYKSKYYISNIFSRNSNLVNNLVIIITFIISPKIKDLKYHCFGLQLNKFF